jgi:hypothetical protein
VAPLGAQWQGPPGATSGSAQGTQAGATSPRAPRAGPAAAAAHGIDQGGGQAAGANSATPRVGQAAASLEACRWPDGWVASTATAVTDRMGPLHCCLVWGSAWQQMRQVPRRSLQYHPVPHVLPQARSWGRPVTQYHTAPAKCFGQSASLVCTTQAAAALLAVEVGAGHTSLMRGSRAGQNRTAAPSTTPGTHPGT